VKALKPTVAMILAAGRGERMRPLSDVMPKPALPLPSAPVVRSAIGLAAAAGVSRVVVNVWHLADRMIEAVEGVNHESLEVVVSREHELMGTSGGLAIAHARGLLGTDGPVLVINGDGFYELDPAPLIRHHAASSDEITLGLVPHPDPSRWSRVLVGNDHVVTGIVGSDHPGAAEEPLLYPGLMVVARHLIEALPQNPGNTPETLWWPAMDRQTLGGVVVSGAWREVGTPADYLEEVLRQLDRTTIIHPTAQVHPTARLDRCLVGRDAVIGEGAEIVETAVLEGAEVAAGARVSRSVLAGAVRISRGDTLHGVFLATER
jgi:NDP-sugar pyrophosphorylase family protein